MKVNHISLCRSKTKRRKIVLIGSFQFFKNEIKLDCIIPKSYDLVSKFQSKYYLFSSVLRNPRNAKINKQDFNCLFFTNCYVCQE